MKDRPLGGFLFVYNIKKDFHLIATSVEINGNPFYFEVTQKMSFIS